MIDAEVCTRVVLPGTKLGVEAIAATTTTTPHDTTPIQRLMHRVYRSQARDTVPARVWDGPSGRAHAGRLPGTRFRRAAAFCSHGICVKPHVGELVRDLALAGPVSG